MRGRNQAETAGIVPCSVAVPGVRKLMFKRSGNTHPFPMWVRSLILNTTIVYLGELL